MSSEQADFDSFIAWKNHPVTEMYFKVLEKEKARLSNDLGAGVTLCDTADGTHGQTSRIVGEIAGLDYALSIKLYNVDEQSMEVF